MEREERVEGEGYVEEEINQCKYGSQGNGAALQLHSPSPFLSAKTKPKQRRAHRSHMPHLATSSAVSGGGAHPTAIRRIALRRPAAVVSCRRPLRARAVGGGDGSVRTGTTEEQATFYDLLGISSEGSFEDVRAAYRRMARKYHPDVSPPDAAKENTRRFIQLQEAYETLSDPSRRHSYDRALARGLCRLAFSASSRQRHASSFYHQEQEEKSGWRTSWEGQIAELKKRSSGKDSEENLSWGARMRRRRAESSSGEQL